MARTGKARPVAVVTGSYRGIGRECALWLGRAGFNLLLNDRNTPEGRELASRLQEELAGLGAESEAVPGDVSNLDVHQAMLDAALKRWERIDCLVNNAGVPPQRRGDLLDVKPESFDQCIQVNTRSVFFLSQIIARHMLSVEGEAGVHRSIVNITSSNAEAVSINRGEYCVSKAASSMTTRLFALRLAKAGIGVYEVRPGLIATEMTLPHKDHYDKLIEEHHLIPAGRWGYPSDVASIVVSMAEGRMTYTVGQAIMVDGGMVMPRF
jgi:NAD(P)-dependent dehydrogenase (short-subunit alcohol dehydrogenase family)